MDTFLPPVILEFHDIWITIFFGDFSFITVSAGLTIIQISVLVFHGIFLFQSLLNSTSGANIFQIMQWCPFAENVLDLVFAYSQWGPWPVDGRLLIRWRLSLRWHHSGVRGRCKIPRVVKVSCWNGILKFELVTFKLAQIVQTIFQKSHLLSQIELLFFKELD